MGLQRRTELRSDPAKVAGWQRRGRKPLRSSPLRGRAKAKKRSAGLGKVSAKRRQEIVKRRNTVVPDGPRAPVTSGPDHAFRKWVGKLCCSVKLGTERSPVEAAHYKTKRCNGDWTVDPVSGLVRGNIIPLSSLEHGEQHSAGVTTFAADRGLDWEATCHAVGRAYCDGWTAFALSLAAREAGGYARVDLDHPPIDPTTEAPW